MLDLKALKIGQDYVGDNADVIEIKRLHKQQGRDEFLDVPGKLIMRQYFDRGTDSLMVTYVNNAQVTVTRLV